MDLRFIACCRARGLRAMSSMRPQLRSHDARGEPTPGEENRLHRSRRSRWRRSNASTRSLTSSARSMAVEMRLAARQERSAALVAALEDWMRAERAKLPRHAAVATAIDYIITRWRAYTRFLADGSQTTRLNPPASAGPRQARYWRLWSRRGADKAAALKLLKKIMKKYGLPQSIVTDWFRAYSAMKEINAADRHEVGGRLNNRAENSHQPFRRRERAMQRFRSMKTLQKFSSVHAQVHNQFTQDRHLVTRQVYKERRSIALTEWRGLAA
jgi:putative transposase